MKLTRRRTLIGLGTITGGVGAAIGSGAFTAVEAERVTSVSLAGDSTARLTLEPVDQAHASIGENGRLTLQYRNLNQDAETRFRSVWKLKNSGSNPAYVFLDGVERGKPYAGDNQDVPEPVEAGRLQAPISTADDEVKKWQDPEANVAGSNLWETPVEVPSGGSITVGAVIRLLDETTAEEWEEDFAVCAFETIAEANQNRLMDDDVQDRDFRER